MEHLSLVNNRPTYGRDVYASSEYPTERTDPWDFLGLPALAWGLPALPAWPGQRSFKYFKLRHLTYLEIEGVGFPGGQDSCLQGLTGLQDLRLVSCPSQDRWGNRVIDSIHASTLSGLQHLTRLQVDIQGPLKLGSGRFDARALQGKTLLQHLQVSVRNRGVRDKLLA